MKLKTNFFAPKTNSSVLVWAIAFGVGLCVLGSYFLLKPAASTPPMSAVAAIDPSTIAKKKPVHKPRPTAVLTVAAQIIPLATATPDPSRIGSFRLVGSAFRQGVWQAFFVSEGQSLALTRGVKVEKLGEIMDISASTVVVKETTGGALKTLLVTGEE